MATSFGYNCQHEAVPQRNLDKTVQIAEHSQFIWDPIHIYISISITSFKIITSLTMCYL